MSASEVLVTPNKTNGTGSVGTGQSELANRRLLHDRGFAFMKTDEAATTPEPLNFPPSRFIDVPEIVFF